MEIEVIKEKRVREYLELQSLQEQKIRTETELDIADVRKHSEEIEFVIDQPTVEHFAEVIVEEIIREVVTEVVEITERYPEVTEIVEEEEIHESPRVVKELVNVETMYRNEIHFDCQVVGTPMPMLTWFHNGQIIEVEEVRTMRALGDQLYSFQ